MNGVAGSVVASGLHIRLAANGCRITACHLSRGLTLEDPSRLERKSGNDSAGIHNADMAATARSLLWTDGTARRHIQEQSMANRNPNDRSNQSGQSGMGSPQRSRQSGQSRQGRSDIGRQSDAGDQDLRQSDQGQEEVNQSDMSSDSGRSGSRRSSQGRTGGSRDSTSSSGGRQSGSGRSNAGNRSGGSSRGGASGTESGV